MTVQDRYYVYQLTISGSEMPIYVGKGSGRRCRNHTTKSSLKKNTRKNNTIKKALREGKEIVVEIIEGCLSEQDAFLLETYCIAAYGLVSSGGCLLNMTSGGEGASGVRKTPEQIEKWLAKVTGQKRSKEVGEAVSKRQRGEDNPSNKLKNDDVFHCYLLRHLNVSQQEISEILGCSRETVGCILRGKRWSHLYWAFNGGSPLTKRKTSTILSIDQVIHAYVLSHEGFLQKEIARLMGCTRATVNQILLGNSHAKLHHHYIGIAPDGQPPMNGVPLCQF